MAAPNSSWPVSGLPSSGCLYHLHLVYLGSKPKPYSGRRMRQIFLHVGMSATLGLQNILPLLPFLENIVDRF